MQTKIAAAWLKTNRFIDGDEERIMVSAAKQGMEALQSFRSIGFTTTPEGIQHAAVRGDQLAVLNHFVTEGERLGRFRGDFHFF